MPSRWCSKCGVAVPSSLYERHKQAHANAIKPRRDRSVVPKVLARDHHRCVKCGRARQPGLALHVHHINGNPNDNRLVNLETRCEDCHPRGGDQPYGLK